MASVFRTFLEKLGGTTPLEIIIKFPKNKTETDDDEFEDWENENNEEDEKKYWFTKDKIDKIASVHNYLDGLPEIGKVLSFSSIIDGHLTTLISCIALFLLGTGFVKGFAATLGIGVLLSLFTALSCTRTLLRFLMGYQALRRPTNFLPAKQLPSAFS